MQGITQLALEDAGASEDSMEAAVEDAATPLVAAEEVVMMAAVMAAVMAEAAVAAEAAEDVVDDHNPHALTTFKSPTLK